MVVTIRPWEVQLQRPLHRTMRFTRPVVAHQRNIHDNYAFSRDKSGAERPQLDTTIEEE